MAINDIGSDNIEVTVKDSKSNPKATLKSALEFKNENINFNVAESFPKQFVFANNKVEALTVINNKIVFATDDENLGAAINISIDGY